MKCIEIDNQNQCDKTMDKQQLKVRNYKCCIKRFKIAKSDLLKADSDALNLIFKVSKHLLESES